MDDIITNEQDIKDATAQDNKPKRSSSRRSKATSACDKDAIIAFLKGCEPYQSDAIQVIINATSGRTKNISFSADDVARLNQYLNHGMSDKDELSVKDAIAHRRQKANSLMKLAQTYCRQDVLINLMNAVTDIAINCDYAEIADTEKR